MPGIGGVTCNVVDVSIRGFDDLAAAPNGDASIGSDTGVSAGVRCEVDVDAVTHSMWAEDLWVPGSAFMAGDRAIVPSEKL